MCIGGSPDIPAPPPPPAIPKPPQEQSLAVKNARDAARKKGRAQSGFASTMLSRAGSKPEVGPGGMEYGNSMLSRAGKTVRPNRNNTGISYNDPRYTDDERQGNY